MSNKYHVGDPVIVNGETTFVEQVPDEGALITGYVVWGSGDSYPEGDIHPVPLTKEVYEDYLDSYKDVSGMYVFKGEDASGESHVVELCKMNNSYTLDGQQLCEVENLHELRRLLSRYCADLYLPQYHPGSGEKA